MPKNRDMLVNVDPKNDYAFKSVFDSQRHSRVLIHLLNAILAPQGLRVQSARVLNPLGDVRELDDKKLILDVKAVDQHGRLYNIEMQMAPAPSFPERFVYYWSSTYGNQLKVGQSYDQLCPVISICFLDGILFPDHDECHLRFKLLETTAQFPFTDHLDLHLFQLPHFIKPADDLTSDLDLWLYVLNNGKGLDLGELPQNLQVAEVEEALEALAVLTQDRMQREIYEAREKARRDAEDWRIALRHAEEKVQESFAKGRESGHEAGREEGREEGRAKGRAEGVLVGRIRTYEELLSRTPKPDAELAAMSIDELRGFADELHAELSRG